MDTRKYKQLSSKTEYVPKNYNDQILEEQDTILKYDKIKNDYKYLDATIFNLCEKIAIGNKLQELYFTNQQQSLNKSSLPKFFKFYVHNTALVPIFCFSIVFMKWRKTLTLHKTVLLLCGLSLTNEFFKYQNCIRMDENLAKAYQDHTQAYDDLFGNLIQTLTFKDVMRLLFNIDFTKEKLQSESHYDNLLVEDFAMNYY
ncbi:unnamed protein product [Paramecium primaurelia]|uniref:Uncharacterized protein n=1 Tax=Paramecium primaurelia TaxID=5886 RepID=A0A8S1NJ76_PARPR|nr:unnamed protein product [Paramecium primaurelia]